VSPARRGGLPWFGRVLSWDKHAQQVHLRWMDKWTKTNNSKYFYLTTEESVHQDTIICNGVDFEPIYGSQLLWQLQTPLPIIRDLQEGKQLNITVQNYTHLAPKETRPVYKLEDMIFANKEEFVEFVQKASTC
jgi:hypothetical protein